MTPTEAAAILRQFNEWRRGDEDIPQFDPREIGAAIDAAVEMIERMEFNLRLIADTDYVEAALDPQQATRLARYALRGSK